MRLPSCLKPYAIIVCVELSETEKSKVDPADNEADNGCDLLTIKDFECCLNVSNKFIKVSIS